VVLIAGTLEAVWTYQELRSTRHPEMELASPAELAKIARKTVGDHRRLVKYIADGDRDGAARTMRKHLGITHQTVLGEYGGCAVEMFQRSPD
jgi:DNA-binding FadR family transcriptional regulator